MTDALLTVVLSGLFGLGGVALGWELNRRTAQLQEQEREARVSRGVRMLLHLESKQNVKDLTEFWSRVMSSQMPIPGIGVLVGVGWGHDEDEFNRRQLLATEPLPQWRTLMWESQAGMVATALIPDEIDRVYTLYSDLATLTARRAELRKELDTPEGKQLASNFRQWMESKAQRKPTPGTSQYEVQLGQALREFNEKTRTLWNDSKVICERPAYKDANLIEEDAPPG